MASCASWRIAVVSPVYVPGRPGGTAHRLPPGDDTTSRGRCPMTSPGTEPASPSRSCTDGGFAPRPAEGSDRRPASAVLADVYALVQHEVVWASEAELTWTAADGAMTAAQDADTPAALAGAAWTLGMVQRSAGDTDAALTLAQDAAGLLEPRLEDASDEMRGLYGALQLHAATTAA